MQSIIVSRIVVIAMTVVVSLGVGQSAAHGTDIDGPIVMSDDGSVYVWEGVGVPRLIAVSSELNRLGAPEWSPDGTRIAVTGSDGIWIMNPDGSDGRSITFPGSGELDENHTWVETDSSPTWSPDGEWIAFTRFKTSYPLPGGDTTDVLPLEGSILRVRSDGSDLRKITEVATWDSETMDGLSWSPDGTRIAYRYTRQIAFPFSVDVVTIAPDGSDPRNLTELYRSEILVWGYPSWSSSGDRIIFPATSASAAREQEAVWSIDREGTNPIELLAPSGASIEFPQFEHDGQRIVYRERGWFTSECALYRHSIGGHRMILHPDPECSRFDLWPKTAGFFDTWNSQFRLDIEWLAAQGITRGCNPPDDFLFCPERRVLRGEMAAFLVRGLDLTDRLDDPFTDDDSSLFEADIERLAAAGVTKGCNPPTNDRFCPDRWISRGEMAALLVRALELPAASRDHFVDDAGSVFQGDINRIAEAGITKGCNPPVNDRFCPDAFVTRAQMAAFLHRALE